MNALGKQIDIASDQCRDELVLNDLSCAALTVAKGSQAFLQSRRSGT